MGFLILGQEREPRCRFQRNLKHPWGKMEECKRGREETLWRKIWSWKGFLSTDCRKGETWEGSNETSWGWAETENGQWIVGTVSPVQTGSHLSLTHIPSRWFEICVARTFNSMKSSLISGSGYREEEEDHQVKYPCFSYLSSFWILHPMKVFTDRCFDFCRKEHDPSKPKHPLSAFFVFSSERRPALVAEKKNVLEVLTETFSSPRHQFSILVLILWIGWLCRSLR